MDRTTRRESRWGGVSTFLSVRYNKWKFIVTIRPPNIMPLAKWGGEIISPTMLATENRIQFVMMTNFKIRCWIFTINIPQLIFSGLFYCKTDISITCSDSQAKKNKYAPRCCIKASVKIHPNSKPDKNWEGNRQAKATVICKFPHWAFGFSFHGKESATCSDLKAKSIKSIWSIFIFKHNNTIKSI